MCVIPSPPLFPVPPLLYSITYPFISGPLFRTTSLNTFTTFLRRLRCRGFLRLRQGRTNTWIALRLTLRCDTQRKRAIAKGSGGAAWCGHRNEEYEKTCLTLCSEIKREAALPFGKLDALDDSPLTIHRVYVKSVCCRAIVDVRRHIPEMQHVEDRIGEGRIPGHPNWRGTAPAKLGCRVATTLTGPDLILCLLLGGRGVHLVR